MCFAVSFASLLYNFVVTSSSLYLLCLTLEIAFIHFSIGVDIDEEFFVCWIKLNQQFSVLYKSFFKHNKKKCMLYNATSYRDRLATETKLKILRVEFLFFECV